MCFTVGVVIVCVLLLFLKINFIFCKWMGKKNRSVSEYFHAVSPCSLSSLALRPPLFDLWLCVPRLLLSREKMESQLEKEARFCQLMAHSSHDSAIDTDSLEWETEVVEFEKDRVSAAHYREQFYVPRHHRHLQPVRPQW